MPLPKFSSRFGPEREVLDYALSQGGARYTLSTPGLAKNWRQRAYHFRKVLWSELNSNNPSPPIPTPYDAIKIDVEENICIIRLENARALGKLEPLGTEAPSLFESDLEVQAKEVAERLGLKL